MAFITKREVFDGCMKMFQRPTGYENSYPYNCGFYDGYKLWGDCWCFAPKSIIWGAASGFPVWDNYEVGEEHVSRMYTQGIANSGLPDWGVDDIANTYGVISYNFSDMDMATFLAISGQHAGIYLGEWGMNGYVYNAAEFNATWYGNGFLPLYVDSNGDYYTHKGGTYVGHWSYNFTLPSFIDYSSEPGPTPTPDPPKPATEYDYRTYDDITKSWLSVVNGKDDFAGIYGHDVDCVALKGAKYQVHCWAGDGKEVYDFHDWLEPVDGYDISDYNNGFAGNYHPIDALLIDCSDELMYQVHYRGGDWEVPVSSLCANINDPENGYAGTIGKPIDAVRIWKK